MTTPPPNPTALVQAAQQQVLVNRYLFIKQQQLARVVQQAKKV